MEIKNCKICQEMKNVSEFYARKDGAFSPYCKVCTCARNKLRRSENRQKSEQEILYQQGKRKCTFCNLIKDFQEFHKKRKSYESCCKECKEEKRRLHYKKNPEAAKNAWKRRNEVIQADVILKEKANKASREYRRKHKDRYDAIALKWRMDNPERAKESCRKWRANNKDIVCWHANKRRVNKIQATPIWAKWEFDEFFVQEIYHLAKLRNKLTNIVWHVDHIVPLKSKSVCGLHCQNNLQLIPKKTNLQKGNRWWPDMWEQEK